MSVMALLTLAGDPERLLGAYRRLMSSKVAREQPLRTVHVCAPTEHGLLIVEVWESRAHLEAVLEDERFGEILREAGVPKPRHEVHEVENVILPSLRISPFGSDVPAP